MNTVPFDPRKHSEYSLSLLPIKLNTEDMKGIVCETDDGRPAAVCLMEKWTKNCVWVHLAVTHPAALRIFLTEVANYIFITCDRKMIFGSVPSDNKKALRLNKHLGYTTLYRVKDYYEDGVDCVIVRMLKSECRFLPIIERQEAA